MADNIYTQEEGNQFIIDCHTNFNAVKEKVAVNPEIVNAYNEEAIESALGAAGHMGRRDIAEFLLNGGARLELAAAAMLNMQDYVAGEISNDSALAMSGGAHGIPVAFHAALSDDPAMLQILWDAGAVDLCKKGIAFAIGFNKLNATRWLLKNGADAKGAEMMGKPILEVVKERNMTEMQALLDGNLD